MKEKLEKQLAALIKNKVCIAFSAGVDSTVLLYACCEAAKKEGIPLDQYCSGYLLDGAAPAGRSAGSKGNHKTTAYPS